MRTHNRNAVDTALHSFATPAKIKRILSGQKWMNTILASLERLVEEPNVPFDLLEYALARVGETCETDQDDMSRRYVVQEIVRSVVRCILKIWYRVLVDRDVIATHMYEASKWEVNQYEAQEGYTAELLDIKDEASLKSNQRICVAFQKTKLVVQRLCQGRGRQGETISSSLSFASMVIVHRLPSFLLWLAIVEDPSCLGMTRDTLLLHEALNAKNMCIYPCKPSGTVKIIFQHEQLANGDGSDSKLLELFNKNSPVQLLCHLTRDRFSDEDRSRIRIDPLNVFLSSFAVERREIEHDWARSADVRMPDTTDFLDDIRAIIGIASYSLETCNEDTGLYPFCVPQLQPHDSTPASSLPHVIEAFRRFYLSLSFELLKANPALVLRHLEESDEDTTSKRTTSGSQHEEAKKMPRKRSHQDSFPTSTDLR